MEHKSTSGKIKFKEDVPGAIQVVFSSLNLIDKDRDVTLPGAFASGERVNFAGFGHDWMDFPWGDATIAANEFEAIADGVAYLDTPQGDKAYKTLKARVERNMTQEWSYGYDVLDAEFGTFNGEPVRFLKKLKVHEVSPVMLGAGERTRTLDVKALEDADFSETFEAVRAFLKAHKEGRALAVATRSRLEKHPESLRQLADEIDTLLADTAPPKGADGLYLDFQAIRARLNGVAI